MKTGKLNSTGSIQQVFNFYIQLIFFSAFVHLVFCFVHFVLPQGGIITGMRGLLVTVLLFIVLLINLILCS